MKSPSADEALKPLYRLEVDASKEHEAALKDYGKAQYQWKMRRDVAEAQHKAALKKNPNAQSSPLTLKNRKSRRSGGMSPMTAATRS
jgi:hypothetical protein